MKKIFFIFLLSFSLTSFIQASTGYIDTAYTNHAKVCYDSTCTSPTPSIVNFELSQQPSITIDSVTGLSGYIWGEALGWIKMNPTGAGVTFANSDTGVLTGKAWSQVSGWINFAVTGQEMKIGPSTGEFSGWAWSGGPHGGWIKFDCGEASTCVKTSWRASTGGSGGGGGPLDVCPNIIGIQSAIPNGYSVDNLGNCIQVIDVCPNLLGDQESIPTGYKLNEIGACIPTEVDYCLNIAGNQYSVPSGYFIDIDGSCVKEVIDACPSDSGVQLSISECSPKQIKKDVCPNLPGIQENLPDRHSLSGGLCYPETFDLCLNIPSSQATVPLGYIISEDGSCILAPDDLCDNLGGSQVIVPNGFIKEGNNCFLKASKEAEEGNVSKNEVIIALPFIPSTIWITSDNDFVKSSTHLLNKVFNNENIAEPYKVDLVSFNLVILGILLTLFSVLIFIKRLIP